MREQGLSAAYCMPCAIKVAENHLPHATTEHMHKIPIKIKTATLPANATAAVAAANSISAAASIPHISVEGMSFSTRRPFEWQAYIMAPPAKSNAIPKMPSEYLVETEE